MAETFEVKVRPGVLEAINYDPHKDYPVDMELEPGWVTLVGTAEGFKQFRSELDYRGSGHFAETELWYYRSINAALARIDRIVPRV